MGETVLSCGEASRRQGNEHGHAFSGESANLASSAATQQLRVRLEELESKIVELQSEANMRLDEIRALRFYAQRLEVALKRQSANVAGLCDFRDGIMREIAEVTDPSWIRFMNREYRLRRFDAAFAGFMQGDQLIYKYGE